MYQEDLQGSIAYAKSLQQAGIITAEEESQIQQGLLKISREWNENKFIIKPSDEDIHTANERRLKELVGEPASKLHTGRSRNDQVVTDMRLWLKSHINKLKILLQKMIKVFNDKSRKHIDIIMPGYTHLQRAQPIRWSHWLLSHTWNFKSDHERLSQLYGRIDVMPLGSGALAGNPFDLDRNKLAKELGFSTISLNSMHAVGDRDFVMEFCFWASLTALHISRLAEDLIIYSSAEFTFVELSDSYTTGSSLMPQKKNPDSLEIIRGKAGYLFGHLCGFMMVMKGLPSTYNKDFQEDKKVMFETYNTMQLLLQITSGVVETLQVNERSCSLALTPSVLATDLAYYLVRKGVPFREAHHLVGNVVAKAEKQKKEITELSIEELQSISSKFDNDIKTVWNYNNSVEQYRTIGGTSRDNILLQINYIERWLQEE